MENIPLFVGYIEKFVEDGIQIASHKDRLPLLQCNTAVKISIMNNALGCKILIGKVYLSTDQFLRVVNVMTAAEYEKRNFFRVRVSLEAKAFLTRGGAAAQGSAEPAPPMEGPIPVKINDLSLSGLFLIADCKMKPGDRLVVSLSLYGTDILLPCRVVRKTTVDLGTKDGYGCEFLENSGRQFDLLCRYLYDCQREQIQAAKEHAKIAGRQ